MAKHGRRRETLIALAGVGVVVAVVAAVLVVLGDVGAPSEGAPGASEAPETSQDSRTTKPKTSAKPQKKKSQRDRRPDLPAALVVKIDNVWAARPHTGLGGVDAMYVEPVESGFTRLLAVYWGKRPSVLGPVRSVRQTDVELLASMRKPVLAYSGAASQLSSILRKANVVHALPENTNGAYFRSGVRAIPHNLYVNPRRLPRTKPVDSPLRTGPRPAGGRRVDTHHVRYRNARYAFTWSDGRWRVSMDGAPLTSTESGQLRAGTVVVQRVRIVKGRGVRDASGHMSPVARTVGSGKVTVLRDGRAFNGKWSRKHADRATAYRTSDGKPLSLGKGPVWVLLVPR